MSKLRFAVLGLLTVIVTVFAVPDVKTLTAPSPSTSDSALAVTLRAASGKTIDFVAQNGRSMGVAPLALDLPHLVLYRDGRLTERQERTLIVEVSGFQVPPSGVTIALRVETQHGDPDLGGGSENRISVWQESQSVAHTQGGAQTGVTAVFVHEFPGMRVSGADTRATPTGYFRYEIAVVGESQAASHPMYVSADYAFLMENQWTVSLPETQEVSNGAAPDELIVYYCDMFPFQAAGERLNRQEVPSYVQTELAPAMVKAYDDQVNGWAMGPWYDEWASFRGEERLSVALAMPGTWFHGRALNHSGISLLTYDDNPLGVQYERLIDEHTSSFQHELFHNLQLNIGRHAGSVNFEHWKFFTEGQAVMVSSVGRGDLATKDGDNYISRANQFLRTALNKSYAKLDPYQGALYWRFLYEKCGGIDKDGVENPAVGMQIIKRSLEALYAEERAADDIIEKLPSVMDRALGGSLCPFQTYEQSLVAFSRANYALRLENGRCGLAGMSQCSIGYYDPGHMYIDPWLETELTYSGGVLPYDGAIPTSYGMDLVKVSLDSTLHRRRVKIAFQSAAPAVFHVEILRLRSGDGKSRAITFQPEGFRPEQWGKQVYLISRLDMTVYDQLGVIITRLDPNETNNRAGAYRLTIESLE